MTRPIDQTKIEIWMYKLMLGILSEKKKELLKEELETRNKNNTLFSALETKVFVAMTLERPFKQTLKELLDDWEKRSSG